MVNVVYKFVLAYEMIFIWLREIVVVLYGCVFSYGWKGVVVVLVSYRVSIDIVGLLLIL